MAQAQARLAANDFEGAATILEDIISRNPTAFRPINLLGTVRKQQKDFDAAIAAHAFAIGATLVTADLAHMTRVPGLKVEDWVQ